MITSASNKRIKNVMLLLSKAKERKAQGLFVTEGVRMFKEAPDSRIREVYLSEKFQGEDMIMDKLRCLQEQNGTVVEHVREDVFCKMCDTRTPQGILCVLSMPQHDLSQLLEKDKQGVYLVLEDIQDPGNLGTMIRSGEGAGISGVIMSRNTVDVFNPKTVRATMGSIYRVPFVYTDELGKTICDMKEKGIQTYAAHLEGKRSYDKEDYRQATAFLIGNEGNGLSRQIADMADAYIRIPMSGRVESLNAAIAATLLIYEAARQRRN